MTIGTVDDIAAVLQLTPRRVQQLVHQGMPRARRGCYDLEQCCAWHFERLRAANARRDAARPRDLSTLLAEVSLSTVSPGQPDD